MLLWNPLTFVHVVLQFDDDDNNEFSIHIFLILPVFFLTWVVITKMIIPLVEIMKVMTVAIMTMTTFHYGSKYNSWFVIDHSTLCIQDYHHFFEIAESTCDYFWYISFSLLDDEGDITDVDLSWRKIILLFLKWLNNRSCNDGDDNGKDKSIPMMMTSKSVLRALTLAWRSFFDLISALVASMAVFCAAHCFSSPFHPQSFAIQIVHVSIPSLYAI